MAYQILFVFLIIVTITRDVSAIKCWRCNSRLKFCGDVLDQTNLTKNELSWYYVPCGTVRKKVNYKGDKMIAKCNIQIELAYDQLVYTRKCVEESETVTSNSCLSDEIFNSNDDPNIQLVSCETCTEDGCNDKINNYFPTGIESPASFGLTSIFVESKSMTVCLLTIILCTRRNI